MLQLEVVIGFRLSCGGIDQGWLLRRGWGDCLLGWNRLSLGFRFSSDFTLGGRQLCLQQELWIVLDAVVLDGVIVALGGNVLQGLLIALALVLVEAFEDGGDTGARELSLHQWEALLWA